MIPGAAGNPNQNHPGGICMKELTPQEYAKMAERASPPSPCLKNCAAAFLVGGGICAGAQGLLALYGWAGLPPEQARTAVTVTLIALSALLTALRVYDRIARVAGAGTLVPVTGFANSVASPAMEFRAEGFVLGVGAKVFSIAGPVIAYGAAASVLYGVVYWVLRQAGAA